MWHICRWQYVNDHRAVQLANHVVIKLNIINSQNPAEQRIDKIAKYEGLDD